MYEDAVSESAGLANVLFETIFSPSVLSVANLAEKSLALFHSWLHSVYSLKPTGSGFQCSWNINMMPSGISDIKSELLAGRPRFTDHRHHTITICYIQGHARTYTHAHQLEGLEK